MQTQITPASPWIVYQVRAHEPCVCALVFWEASSNTTARCALRIIMFACIWLFLKFRIGGNKDVWLLTDIPCLD